MRQMCTLLAVLGIALAPAFGQAPFRCGDGLVSLGETREQVLEQCGEPTSTRRYNEFEGEGAPIQLSDGEVVQNRLTAPMEEWVYNFGSTQFTKILIFRNGVLANIKSGEYGE